MRLVPVDYFILYNLYIWNFLFPKNIIFLRTIKVFPNGCSQFEVNEYHLARNCWIYFKWDLKAHYFYRNQLGRVIFGRKEEERTEVENPEESSISNKLQGEYLLLVYKQSSSESYRSLGLSNSPPNSSEKHCRRE